MSDIRGAKIFTNTSFLKTNLSLITKNHLDISFIIFENSQIIFIIISSCQFC